MRHPPSTAAQLSFFAQPPSWKDLSLRGGLLLSSARICLHWWMDLDFFLGHILEYFLSFLLVYIKKLYGGAAAGVPPVLEGRPLPLSRLFFPGACQVRHELVWLLFPGSIWSLGGCDRFCSSVVGYRVSRFGCCWGGHFVCCDCDACWGWRFCLLLPLLFLACLVISSVRESPALAGVAVGRLVMGPTDVLRALQGKVSFFCPLFASSGGGAVALPQIRLWMTDLSLLLPVPGMRLEVRILVALPGILSARLVLGRRGLLQGLSLCQSGARLRSASTFGCGGC